MAKAQVFHIMAKFGSTDKIQTRSEAGMVDTSNRILTTHVGSLPRPRGLIELFRDKAPGDEREHGIREAITEVVRQQAEIGIDIVNDGEYSKPTTGEIDFSPFVRYWYDRVSGYEVSELPETEWVIGKDRQDFAEYYGSGAATMSDVGTVPFARCVGEISYQGHGLVQRDIANLRSALDGVEVAGAFATAITPAMPAVIPDSHYGSADAAAEALAAAIRTEYAAWIDAGFTLQIDDPALVNVFEHQYSFDWDIKGFRTWAESHIERLNKTIAGLPAQRLRYHMCWGSWVGPHSTDLPLKDVIDLMLKVNASQYLIEGANPQHEHEWEVWQGIELPAGKTVVPGVVTHKTSVLEHPEVVAQRIVRYADAVGRENVIAGTDCGLGGRIDRKLAWAKLKVLVQGAELASERLWR
jgi:5-methyltetrahydropteroyltriglutamate--homocysteine methyltransferase